MRSFFFAAFFLAATFTAIGQEHRFERQLIIIKKDPVHVMVAGLETTFQALIIDAGKISTTVLPDREATMQLQLKDPKLSLVRLDAILNKFNIPDHKRKLSVCIDKVLIKDPSKILADLGYIQRVELTTDRYPANIHEMDIEEEVINIVTPRSFYPG